MGLVHFGFIYRYRRCRYFRFVLGTYGTYLVLPTFRTFVRTGTYVASRIVAVATKKRVIPVLSVSVFKKFMLVWQRPLMILLAGQKYGTVGNGTDM
jgi:hypothetical protein